MHALDVDGTSTESEEHRHHTGHVIHVNCNPRPCASLLNNLEGYMASQVHDETHLGGGLSLASVAAGKLCREAQQESSSCTMLDTNQHMYDGLASPLLGPVMRPSQLNNTPGPFRTGEAKKKDVNDLEKLISMLTCKK